MKGRTAMEWPRSSSLESQYQTQILPFIPVPFILLSFQTGLFTPPYTILATACYRSLRFHLDARQRLRQNDEKAVVHTPSAGPGCFDHLTGQPERPRLRNQCCRRRNHQLTLATASPHCLWGVPCGRSASCTGPGFARNGIVVPHVSARPGRWTVSYAEHKI